MQVKFLQVADFHLDSKFLGLLDLEKISLRKKEVEETFKKIIKFTNAIRDDEGLDFITFAGDLFEQDYFTPQTIKSLIIYGLESLRPLPVFICAGNHDPLQEDSPYLIYNWPDNVHIFSQEFQKIEVKPDVFIYGISVTPENRKHNVLRELKIEKSSGINIVMFHGAETGSNEINDFGDCLPFSSQDILDSPADYFILGHYHNARKVPREGDVLKGFYSGTPEAISFKETGERFILRVSLEKKNPPLVEKISFQHRVYEEIEIDCTGAGSSEDIKNLLLERKDRNKIVNVILRGYVDPDIRVDTEELLDFIRQEDIFFAANIKNNIRPNYTQDLISSSSLAQNYLKVLDKIGKDYSPDVMELAKFLGLDAIFTREVRNWNEI